MRVAAILLLGLASCRCAEPPPAAESPLDQVVPAILSKDHIPSAVVVVGDADRITYRKAFGNARLDTIFDLASCTKVVATTTAALRLVEEGKLALEDPIGKYLPAFNGRAVTIRELLTHRSGFPAYLTPKSRSSDAIITEIAALKTGSGFRYSCLNMISMARIVEQIVQKPLAAYVQETVFAPLGMKDTGFDPPPSRCAPTSSDAPGVVHDPLARTYRSTEHCPGNAGLFSTGDDLALFCQALLKGKVLKPETVTRMFEPDLDTRGLGWDVFDDAPFKGGVGHTGFTGTLIWIDPARARFCLVLTNRVLSGETTNVTRLRREVLSVINRDTGQ